MKKFLWLLFLGIMTISTPLAAQEAEVSIPENEGSVEDLVHYGHEEQPYVPEIKELTPEEDDLYDGGEIKPLRGKLSTAEKEQKGGGFEEDGPRLPELPCSNEKLREQVGKFMFDFTNQQPKRTVPGRRAQVLLVRNMNAFEEVEEKDLKKNFEASAALIYLKMNENREIYKLCSSMNNDDKSFKNVDIIIYPFLNFYKIVVTNLISEPEKMDEATFIYNW